MSQAPNDATNQRSRAEELTTNDRHRLLANERCRLALDALAAHPNPLSVTELAEAVVCRAGHAADANDADEVAVSLHHAHLPRLAEAGAISYDPAEQRIEPDREVVDELST